MVVGGSALSSSLVNINSLSGRGLPFGNLASKCLI